MDFLSCRVIPLHPWYTLYIRGFLRKDGQLPQVPKSDSLTLGGVGATVNVL